MESPRAVLRHPRVRRVITFLLVLVGAYVVLLPVLVVLFVAHPPRHPEATSFTRPTLFDEGHFTTEDGVSLRFWAALPTGTARYVVIQHGLGDFLGGVAGRGEWLARQGYGVILPELRNHGASDSAKTTLGMQESADLIGLLEHLGVAERDLVLWGQSMGGATVSLAAPRLPGVRGIILDSAYDGIWETLDHHRTLLPLPYPRVPMGLLGFRLLEAYTGTDLHPAGSVVAALEQMTCPLLVIGGEEDGRMPPQVQKRLRQTSSHPASELWIIPGAGHIHGYFVARREFQERVLRLLEHAFPEGRKTR